MSSFTWTILNSHYDNLTFAWQSRQVLRKWGSLEEIGGVGGDGTAVLQNYWSFSPYQHHSTSPTHIPPHNILFYGVFTFSVEALKGLAVDNMKEILWVSTALSRYATQQLCGGAVLLRALPYTLSREKEEWDYAISLLSPRARGNTNRFRAVGYACRAC